MAAGDPAAEDRTEAPSPQRLQRAREAGQTAVSRELPAFAALAAFALVLALAGPDVSRDLALRLSILFRRFDLSDAAALRLAALAGLRALAPAAGAALVAGAGAVLLQTGFLVSFAPLKPDPGRLSPAAGLRRLFGADAAVEALKALLRLAAMGGGRLVGAARRSAADPRGGIAARPKAAGGDRGAADAAVLLAVLAVQAAIDGCSTWSGCACAHTPRPAHEPRGTAGGAEGVRRRSQDQGADPPDPRAARSPAHVGRGAEGDGGGDQSDALCSGAGL